MNHVLLLLFVFLIGASAIPEEPVPAGTSAGATTRQAESSLAPLIAELRSPRFAVRESAQKKLAALGESIVSELIPFLNDPDPEVAGRVAELVGKPRDPSVRVEVAARLLATTDPDWMERAVHMLFEDPVAVCDRFVARTRGAEELQRIIVAPVVERLLAAKKRHENFDMQYQGWLRKKPDFAAKMLKMNKETDLYDAEAAYWSAHDAMIEWQEARSGRTVRARPTASQPSGRSP